MIYPVVVVQTRYGGAYEGGQWVAFAGWSIEDINSQFDDIFGDDERRCMIWWEKHKNDVTIATADSADSAVENLYSNIKASCVSMMHPPRFITGNSCTACGMELFNLERKSLISG